MSIIPKVAADFETSLDTSVAQGDTTGLLLSILDTDGIALSNGYYGFTVDNDTDYKEFILCTLTGTAISNVFSVSDQGVATAGFSNYHRRGAVVQITDHVSLLKVVQTLTGEIGIDNASPLFYAATPTLVSGLQLATVQYVLNTVNGGPVSFNAEIIAGMAGETITIGQWVYLKVSDGRWYKTDATDATKSTGVRIGKALGAGTAGGAIAGGVFINGLETTGTYSAFTSYFLSNTPGAIATSAGTFSVTVGFADGNSKLIVAQIDASHRNALVGSSGTPSSSNTYLTQLSTSVAGIDQSQLFHTGTFSVGESNATSRHVLLAQSFIPTKTQLRGVNLYKAANTGTFTGTVSISIETDAAGSPSGTDLGTRTFTNVAYNSYAVGDFLALFASEITLIPGNTYWIVIVCSTNDTANCINLGTNTSGGYANGVAKFNNPTDGWVLIPTIDLYFKTQEGVNGKELTGASGLTPPATNKILFKNGNIAVVSTASGIAVAHGLGKVPAIIRGFYNVTTTTNILMSDGSYDVANSLYAYRFAYYDEGTAGNSTIGTTKLVGYGTADANSITIFYVDENIVTFIGNTGTTTIGYEIIA